MSLTVIDQNTGEFVDTESLGVDLTLYAKSLTFTLSGGLGSVLVDDNAHLMGFQPVSSTTMRVGWEAPEADGTKTLSAVASDFKKGFPLPAAQYTYVKIGKGTSRTLYLKGGTSDVIEILYM
jgi:hypothetical protein